MPLKVKVKRKLTAKSERVKCVELHPTEPWLLASLYTGKVYIWNTDSKKVIRNFEVCDVPVRAAKFVPRKNWIVTASDDTAVRVFNYNTWECVHEFQAHADYIRSLAVHPIQPLILTCADDGRIKLWNWEKKWACVQIFKGHANYVFHVAFNPKDNNQFASASLDGTVKVWQLGSLAPNFTLHHENDVNCVDYHPGGDKPYLVTGEDAGAIRIWNYQTKDCVQVLHGHSKDVLCVAFHPFLPIILSGGADGSLRIWHANTYKQEKSLNYGMERLWTIGCQRGSNSVALGFDEGTVLLKIGNEEPAVSMDSSGKIIWSKNSMIQQANVKSLGEQSVIDGERLELAVKDLGSCEVYPQSISHNPNGRFVVVCGDGEYIIYTAMALRNKAYGNAHEFVWGQDSSTFAIRDDSSTVKVFKNFKMQKSFKVGSGAEGIHGGQLLGVRSKNNLSFYDWETTELVRDLEITATQVHWSESGDLVCVCSEDSFHILKYSSGTEGNGGGGGEEAETETGGQAKESFVVMFEIEEKVRCGLWLGDCFIYTNNVNRLNYCVGGQIVTIAHLDREMYILGYILKDNRLYLGDKELNIISYSLSASILEYQTAVLRRDFDLADKILTSVPREQRTRVAEFLENQGFLSQALAVTQDTDHKFELSIRLGDLRSAYSIAKSNSSPEKWKTLSELALKHSEFGLLQECLHRAQDLSGLLLLASASGNREAMTKLVQTAENADQHNISFLANFTLGRCEECLEVLIKTNRLPEAAFFARTYLPSQTSRVVSLWKAQAAKESQKLSEAIADPSQYENLFPGFLDCLKTEQYLKPHRQGVVPAHAYAKIPGNHERQPVTEMKSAPFVYRDPRQSAHDGDDTPERQTEETKPIISPDDPRSPTPLREAQRSKDPTVAESSPSMVQMVGGPKGVNVPKDGAPEGVSAQKDGAPEGVSVRKDGTPEGVNAQKDKGPEGVSASGMPAVEELEQAIEEIEEELGLDLDGVNIDDFDMVDDFDEEELLKD
ncbi:coatomer subunit beta' [Aplysia californica]|uniref:Coatomer subunit beta' n=1 Tax=Aplysia californica TaxID=6500 RepID=A0ABM0ZZM3_APLCA|nr:coatomer subunit beta' [Aplysia californica]